MMLNAKSLKTIFTPMQQVKVSDKVMWGAYILIASEMVILAGQSIHYQRKYYVAKGNYMYSLSMALRIMDYADQSLVPQELQDELQFRCITAMMDAPPEAFDIPEEDQ